jgi:hypothetical protein
MQTLGHIFYAIGLFIFLLDLINLFNHHKTWKVAEWAEAFKKINKRSPKKADYRTSDDYNAGMFTGFIALSELIWCILGLISGSWKVFAMLFIFAFFVQIIQNIIGKILNKKCNDLNKYISYIYLTIKSAILMILVLNHFHLHLDLFNLI